MKINKSITITDLPGGVTLEKLENGILVTMGAEERTFLPAELSEFRDALTAMLDEFPERVQQDNGPWDHLKDIPASVTAVRDKDGDRLNRLGNGSWGDDDGNDYWSQKYGPFQAAR